MWKGTELMERVDPTIRRSDGWATGDRGFDPRGGCSALSFYNVRNEELTEEKTH